MFLLLARATNSERVVLVQPFAWWQAAPARLNLPKIIPSDARALEVFERLSTRKKNSHRPRQECSAGARSVWEMARACTVRRQVFLSAILAATAAPAKGRGRGKEEGNGSGRRGLSCRLSSCLPEPSHTIGAPRCPRWRLTDAGEGITDVRRAQPQTRRLLFIGFFETSIFAVFRARATDLSRQLDSGPPAAGGYDYSEAADVEGILPGPSRPTGHPFAVGDERKPFRN